jgi:nicotinate phosphoribosyltransferase
MKIEVNLKINRLKELIVIAVCFVCCESGLASQCLDPLRVVKSVLWDWRSPHRFIDGAALREEAELFIRVYARRNLAKCSQKQILEVLKNPTFAAEWALTLADAENILRIRRLGVLTQQQRRPFVKKGPPRHGFQDEISGMTQEDLDRILTGAALPKETTTQSKHRSRRTFSYTVHKLKNLALKSRESTGIDNDLYAFTVAAIFHKLGFHESKEAVFESTSRGADQYPFLVVGGQSQVLDLLENLRFTRWDVEVIKKQIGSRIDVDEGFWDWLIKWRFRGEVRVIPDGSVVFPHTPLLQVTADPASAIIVESLLNPWLSFMTNLTTTAARNLLAAGGNIKSVADAGTRRLVTGNLSALTAMMGGASGTSNMLMAELTGMPAYGTMSHAFVAAFPTEMEAFEAFAENSRNPSLLLPDTYHLSTGLRTAVRAAGEKVATVRQDSNIIDEDGREQSTAETVQEIRKIWEALGKGKWGGVVTNDLTEDSLRLLANMDGGIDVASVGGAFAASTRGVSHGNMVYKLVQMRDRKTGEVRYPIKISNGVKSTEPGQKDVYRVHDASTGLAVFDIKEQTGFAVSLAEGQRATSLLELAFKDGRRRLRPEPVSLVAARTARHFAELDPLLLDLDKTRTSLGDRNYSVVLSDRLVSVKKKAIEAVTPPRVIRILVFPGSFSPVTEDGHLAATNIVSELFKNQVSPQGFDKIVFVPTGESPAHGRQYDLSSFARLEQLRRRLNNWSRENSSKTEFEIFEGEIDSGGGYTIDSLRAIQLKNPGAEITIAMGEDVFWSIGRKSSPWKDADRILSDFGIVVLQRQGAKRENDDSASDRKDTFALLKSLGFVQKPNAFVLPSDRGLQAGRTGETEPKRIEFLNPHFKNAISATEVRGFYDRQGFSGMVHVTDPQWTFAKRLEFPNSDQSEDGTLSVPGTGENIRTIAALFGDVVHSKMMKLSISGDSHLEVEVRDPSQNGEFHEPMNFPRHAMKGETGPSGDRFIVEIERQLEGRRIIRVPAHEEVTDSDGRIKLGLVPFDLESVEGDLADVGSVFRFDKNGVASYSVFVNPRYQTYLEKIDPYKVLPHFHFGWCTDFCDFHVMKGELQRGYFVIFIADAAAGVGAKTTGKAMRELLDLGLVIMSSDEFLALNRKWYKSKSNWTGVLNDLALWRTKSSSQARLVEELKAPRYKDPDHPGDLGEACVRFLTRP